VRLAALSFFAALGLLIVLADLAHLPGWALAVYALPAGDKAAHFALAGAGAYLADRGWPRGAGARSSLGLGVVLSLEELSQLACASRVPDPLDLAATWAGIACGAWLAAQGR